VPARAVARIMGRSAAWFYGHRTALEKHGFPMKDRLLGGWHRPAVEAWLAKRAGTVESLTLEAERQAGREGIHAQAARRRHAVRHRQAG